MATPQVAIDPLGFGRLAAQNVQNRQLSIQEQDAARRGELQDLQIQSARGAEQSRLGTLARQQRVGNALSQGLSNIPEGQNRFSVAHKILSDMGATDELAQLRKDQETRINNIKDKRSQVQAHNATFGLTDGIKLDFISEKDPFKATDAQGNEVFIEKDDQGQFQVVEGFTPGSGAGAGEDVFKNETTLRKEFVTQSGEFIKSRDAIGRVRAAGKDPSPAGDLALIFNFMKVLDPGSVVRESEFRTAADARAWVQKQAAEGKELPNFLQGPLNKLTTGQKLIDSQRKDFLNRAERLFSPIKSSHDKRVGQFKGLAKRNKLDVRNIVLDITGEEEQAVLAEEQPVAVEQTTTVETPTGAAAQTTAAAEQPAAAAGFKVVGIR